MINRSRIEPSIRELSYRQFHPPALVGDFFPTMVLGGKPQCPSESVETPVPGCPSACVNFCGHRRSGVPTETRRNCTIPAPPPPSHGSPTGFAAIQASLWEGGGFATRRSRRERKQEIFSPHVGACCRARRIFNLNDCRWQSYLDS